MTRYLIRLDDACPSMDRNIWGRIEDICDTHKIRPIVGVIPDNRHPVFQNAEPDAHFWKIVRRWEEKGWCIGLHGHTHEYVTQESGMVPINRCSEFAGLPLAVQREKIRSAWAICAEHGIAPSVWVAPAHSFDERTLEALRLETSIRIISDGIALGVFAEKGFLWIPQQLWRLRWMPFGLFTVCIHPHLMKEEACDLLERRIKKFLPHITHLQDIVQSTSQTCGRNWSDRAFAVTFFSALSGWKLWAQLKHPQRPPSASR